MAESSTTTTTAEVASMPVVVKKYANRRLYNTETSSYITLDNLAEMIRAGRDFVVYDAKSGEDITRGVLTQIIVEEESKGSAMLPTNFLRQLIGFYGGNLQGVVPSYLEQAMSTFARQQQQIGKVVQQTFGPFIPAGVEEMSRQNMAMIERAMSLFNPFVRATAETARAAPTPAATEGETLGKPGEGESITAPPVEDKAGAEELAALRHEVDSLRAQLAIAQAEAVMHTATPTAPKPDAPGQPREFAAVPAQQSVPAEPQPLSPAAERKARTGRKPR